MLHRINIILVTYPLEVHVVGCLLALLIQLFLLIDHTRLAPCAQVRIALDPYLTLFIFVSEIVDKDGPRI